MEKELILKVELIPESAWNKNLRTEIGKNNWNKLKSELYEKEGKRCWICGSTTPPLEAHEEWDYTKSTQKLVGIHHLCHLCHKVKHWGFWNLTRDGRDTLKKFNLTKEDLENHFCKVNECDKDTLKKHVKDSFKIWRERSEQVWTSDFGVYSKYLV